MNSQPHESDVKDFFQCLGEIWRDVAATEFLMRRAIAQKEGDITKLPQHPYSQGSEFIEYPRAFSIRYFSDVVKGFPKWFQGFAAPNAEAWDLLIEFRNAMAHV